MSREIKYQYVDEQAYRKPFLIGQGADVQENPHLVVARTLSGEDYNLNICLFIPAIGELWQQPLPGVADIQTPDKTTYDLGKLILETPEIRVLETVTRGSRSVPYISDTVFGNELMDCKDWSPELKGKLVNTWLSKRIEICQKVIEMPSIEPDVKDGFLSEIDELTDWFKNGRPSGGRIVYGDSSTLSKEELVELARQVVHREMSKYFEDGVINRAAVDKEIYR